MNRIGALLILAMIAVVPAVAHHGWAGYSEEEFEISGTLESQVALAGPHGTMKIKAANGQVWDITLAPPARVQGAGLTNTTIPLGAKVIVHGHRHRDPKRFEVKTERVTYEGKLYNVYPDRK
jgi:hypothetical protein